jgi:hypothetical protein
MEDGYITPVKVRQFLSELKGYIEESNDEVTLGRVLS